MAESLDSLKEKVRALRSDFEAALRSAKDAQALQSVRDRFLGRKSGAVTALLKLLGSLAEDARREAGQELNRLKADIESGLEQAQVSLESSLRDERLQRDRIDVTLPGRAPARGHRHLLTATREALEDIFLSMGYEALNMPPDHPARDMQDTFYLAGAPGFLLRTHTSTAQIRYMLENPHPPTVRIICPGKVYRRDDDITHSPMFQQIEALVVGPTITLADLKGTIEAFLHALFGPQYPIRFRPSFFPYTEPSMEADLACVVCGGKGCRVCKGTGWLEIMGSGVVHPAVFEAVNARLGRVAYDPEKVTGFAFGLGIERVAMVRHAIDNIRLFYENDLRFLEQFGA
jgi:phenylalanyl-tRNA synthetase alpha chain